MLDLALEFIADELNAFLAARTGSDTVQVKLTRFPTEAANKYAFDEGSLGLTVINLEEERTVRSQLPTHAYVNGQHVVREPDVKLNLHVLIGANFKQYDEALKHLSLVILFFQSHPVFTPGEYPALDPAIERLAVELQSPGYEQLNQIWGFVGTKQLPSVIYKIRMVVMQDSAPAVVRPPVTGITTAMSGAMNVQFLPLFTLRVAHGFYAGACRDFVLVVPSETSARLRNGRLLAREVEGVLHVLFEAGEDGDPLVPISGATLRLGLQLLNPHFGNFTELPAGFPARRLRYTNRADPRVLAREDDFAFAAETFSHALSQEGRPATVTLRDGAGAVLQLDNVAADDGRTAVSYDLRGGVTGPLELEEIFPGPATVTTALYLDAELRQRDPAVVVEITVDAGFYAGPPDLLVPFDTRSDVLTYYVVVDGYTANEFNSLSVSDEGFEDDDRPEVTFDRVAPAPADLPEWLVPAAEERVVLFRSGDELPRRERGRRRIQLSKNGDVLMANLPQPGVERAQADLILHLSKP